MERKTLDDTKTTTECNYVDTAMAVTFRNRVCCVNVPELSVTTTAVQKRPGDDARISSGAEGFSWTP